MVTIIAVGGCGGNVANQLYKKDINANFLYCDNDILALQESIIPQKIDLSCGELDASNFYEKTGTAVSAKKDEILQLIDGNSDIVCLIAGMGRFTGTGATPFIAQFLRKMGIYTVAIITVPYKFQGNNVMLQAINGIVELSKYTSTSIVVNNEKLRELNPDLSFLDAFPKSDDVIMSIAQLVCYNKDRNAITSTILNSRLASIWGTSINPQWGVYVSGDFIVMGFSPSEEDIIRGYIKEILISEERKCSFNIFISYKRNDKSKVFAIKNYIERETGERCWIDLDGIESDAQFANVIIKAINNSEVFVFMYSHLHAQIEDFENDWTVREINFAQTKKKRIVFINIDGTQLTDWFELFFGTKQQIDASSEYAMHKLCVDLKKWINH